MTTNVEGNKEVALRFFGLRLRHANGSDGVHADRRHNVVGARRPGKNQGCRTERRGENHSSAPLGPRAESRSISDRRR